MPRNKVPVGKLRQADVRQMVGLAIKEDVGSGDVTTRHFVPRRTKLKGYIVAKEDGILCGIDVAREVFRQIAPNAILQPLARDGQIIHNGQKIARISGPRELLTAERIALNFLQRLSGIATLTHSYADRLRGTPARLYDTRKTVPAWRALDKYAVRCGGGMNHRMGLYDAVMIKDNHLALARQDHAHIRSAIRRFKFRNRRIPIIMESKTRSETEFALSCAADIILLDNMAPAQLKSEIRLIRSRNRKVEIEVSGGVTLKNIHSIALLGPDRVSVGRITHSAPALDLSLEIGT